MSQLLFAAWVVAGAVLIFPFGMLLRVGRRLPGRNHAARRRAVPMSTASALDVVAVPHTTAMEATEPSLSANLSTGEGTARPVLGGRRRLAAVLNLLLYVAFIAGAIYFVPQILSWALDTPHPLAAVSSQSMWPTLRKGDLIFLKGVDKLDDLQIGDIIAFRHEKGITVHRILEIDGDVITTQGDSNPVADKPIRFDQVIGRVITIGGRLAKVPKVGSVAGLFGPLATQAGQSPEQEESSGKESGGLSALPEPSESTADQTARRQRVNDSPGTTELVSVDSAGNQANGPSTSPALSGDGRFVAFVSAASNLASGDTGGEGDIFVHDRQTGVTEGVSVDSAGNQANGSSSSPALSADGRFVAFQSAASNLVSGDTNDQPDIFVHDRQTGITERVSVDSVGNQADGGSSAPALSADGRFVAFQSEASNLVSGDTNGQSDVFVHDRQTRATERVSVDSAGNQADGSSSAPALSADGRFVAFESDASGLVPGDANKESDIFVRDRQTGATELVSVDSRGNQGAGKSMSPTISADGRFVAFASRAANLIAHDYNRDQDILVHDRETGTTEPVSVSSAGRQSSAPASAPAISADGRFVTFQAADGNLVPGDTNGYQDVFVHDRQTGATEVVSVDSAGYQGTDHSSSPAISTDGRFTAFASYASNLVLVDHWTQSVFVRSEGPAAPSEQTQ